MNWRLIWALIFLNLFLVSCNEQSPKTTSPQPSISGVFPTPISTVTPSPTATPTASATPTATPSPTASSTPIAFTLTPGLCTHLNSGPRMDRVVEAGFKWIRIDLVWCLVEPARGQFDFTEIDKAVSNAERLGLKIYGSLACTPKWASGNGGYGGVPNIEDWKGFVRKISQRYKNRISAMGVWNEPNLNSFWSGTAEQYINILLKPASAIIRAEAPGTLVVGPELAHLYSATISLDVFFQALKNANVNSEIDVFSHHIYGDADFEQKLLGFYFGSTLYKNGFKQYLEMANLWNKKTIWITEFGINEKIAGEDKQAQGNVDQFKIMNRVGWIQKAFLFELDDNHNEDYRYGILKADATPKKSYTELKKFLGYAVPFP